MECPFCSLSASPLGDAQPLRMRLARPEERECDSLDHLNLQMIGCYGQKPALTSAFRLTIGCFSPLPSSNSPGQSLPPSPSALSSDWCSAAIPPFLLTLHRVTQNQSQNDPGWKGPQGSCSSNPLPSRATKHKPLLDQTYTFTRSNIDLY